VHRDEHPLHAGELGLESLLGGVHDDVRALPEEDLLDLDEPNISAGATWAA